MNVSPGYTPDAHSSRESGMHTQQAQAFQNFQAQCFLRNELKCPPSRQYLAIPLDMLDLACSLFMWVIDRLNSCESPGQ